MDHLLEKVYVLSHTTESVLGEFYRVNDKYRENSPWILPLYFNI